MESLSVWGYLKRTISRFVRYKPGETPPLSDSGSAKTSETGSAGLAWVRRALGVPEGKVDERRLSWKEKAAEWGFIALFVGLYYQPILGIGTNQHLPGNESNFFQLFSKLLEIGLKTGQGFPLWNPYFFTGMPYVGDAMSHAFNPFITGPVLLFGTLNGFKVAILVNMIFGALGMWWLARQMELARPARIWAGLMFAFCGVAAAKFIQGQYLLVIGLGWLAFSLAALLHAIKSGKPAAIAVSALSFALLFFGGNAYFAYFMLWVILFVALFFLPDLRLRPWQFHVSHPRALTLLKIGALSLGLVAIQLAPMVEMFPYIGKQGINSAQSHTPAQVWLNFTSKEMFREDTRPTQDSLRPEEYYAYLGIIPFIGAGIALLAIPFSAKRRWISFYITLILFTLAWVNLQAMPWRDFLGSLPVISGFRFQTRMLAVGTVAIIALSAIGFDTLWRFLNRRLERQESTLARTGIILATVFFLGSMSVSVLDVFSTNQKLARTFPKNNPDASALAWLRTYDAGLYRVSAPNNWYLAAVALGIRQMDLWYPVANVRSYAGQINTRPVEAQAQYLIRPGDVEVKESVERVGQTGDFAIYKNLEALPFAFYTPAATLSAESMGTTSPLTAPEVTPIGLDDFDNNSYQVAIETSADDNILIVTTSSYPGWKVSIDGQPAPLLKVGGFLAVAMLPGERTYRFEYAPESFYTGALISLLALVVCIWLLSRELRAVNLGWPGNTLTKVHVTRSNLTRLLANITAKQPMASSAEQRESPAPIKSGDIEAPANIPAKNNFPGAILGKFSANFQRLKNSKPITRLPKIDPHGPAWQNGLIIAALVVYAIMVLVGLDRYPIYFFTDEAVHMNLAADFIRDGFRNHQKELFPTYFSLGPMFSINSVSVYVQVIPYLLFGKSILVTRAVSALITLLGALFVILILKHIFKSRHAWLGALVLIANAAWFLHARTAFEYIELSAFFAGFLYFYLRYRSGHARSIYGAVFFGALAFYTHGLGQILMGATTVLLLLMDIRYHLKPEHRNELIRAVILAALFFLPFVRYYISHHDMLSAQLAQRGSYWSNPDLGFSDKVLRFFGEYLKGLNPRFWFFETNTGLIRHIMKDYSHLWLPALPGVALGLFQIIRNIRDARYTTLAIALLVSPVPAALVEASITRMLWFIIPATLLAALGYSALLSWVEARFKNRALLISLAAFLLISTNNLFMLRDALTNGPTWFENYSLYGLQFGAQQVFEDNILPVLKEEPATEFRVSPNWANGADQLARFFIPEAYLPRVRMDVIDNYMQKRLPILPQTLFVMIPDEYNRAMQSPVFEKIDVVNIIPYPNGQPGFYITRVTYSENAEAIFAQEALARSQPMQSAVEVNGETLNITYSRIEAGQILDIFDGKPGSLIRGLQANPFIIDIAFPNTKTLSGFSLTIATIPGYNITSTIYAADGSTLETYSHDFSEQGSDPTINVNFKTGSVAVSRLLIEITDNRMMETTKTHIRELQLLP